MNYKIMIAAAFATAPAALSAQTDSISKVRPQNIEERLVDIGADRLFKADETAAAVSVISQARLDQRSAKNVGYALVGQGEGLIAQKSQGIYGSTNAGMIVRGLQSLSGSSPLVLVDGIERSINDVSTDEVESVSILKDAAATALYGYKGANGAVLVTTKRGKYNSRSEVKFTYDHVINYLTNRPRFVNAGTYADAVNEAYANDGLDPRYSQQEVEAFKSGRYPQYYADVNWVDETFRNHGVTNKYGLEFTGGAQRFRYYTALNLLSDKGFIKTPDATDGYSTQDKYVRGNVRVNLDIDLTPKTQLRANFFGTLSEQNQPGSATNLWGLMYTVPSAAFPIRTYSEEAAKTVWGGSSTWAGTSNPLGQSTDAAYYKQHSRSLLTDITLTQDLSAALKGLKAQVRLSYDATSLLAENYSKTYRYDVTSIPAAAWTDSGLDETLITHRLYGQDTEMGTGAETKSFGRQFHFDGGFNYSRDFAERHSIYSQLKWDYEFSDKYANNSTVYRQDFSFYTHYNFDRRLSADLTLVASGSNKLAPGHKWSLAPTVAAAWTMSNEKWMKQATWLNFLKLRASAGILSLDLLPGSDSEWNYYLQGYTENGPTYIFGSNYEGTAGRSVNRLPNTDSTHEKAYKYNVGMDARLFGGLNLSFDYFYQRRSDIWVSGDGAYSAIVAFGTPYINAGRVSQKGFEASADWTKDFDKLTLNIGANMTYSRSKILDQAEEPRAYENLVQTGHQLGQIYGLKAIGFFQDEADIANSPTQTFSTVQPGDVKYEDVNGDNIIDANDKTAIGHTTTPNLYYQFHLGAEYKGFGLYALFQGTGLYSGSYSTKGYQWGLIGNSNISEEAYYNRWTTATAATATYPRLSSTANANNYQTSTLWLVNRAYFKLRTLEAYYNLPETWMEKTGFIKAAKVTLTGTDLFTADHISGADAEGYNASQPLTRSVTLGLKLTF